jgi:hypothetical protein
MHTTNWDNKPLLSVPVVGTVAAIKSYNGNSPHASNGNHDEPSSTAAVVQNSGGTAAAIKKYKISQGSGGNHYGPSSTADSIENGGGTVAAIKNYKSLQVGSHYGPSGSETDYFGPVKHSTTDNHYGPLSGDDFHGGGSKNKWQRKDKHEASDNGSYYSSSGKDLGEDDFVSVPKSSKNKRKKQKKLQGGNVKDGFELSLSALAKRARRFSGAGGISSVASVPVSPESNMKRFMGLALIGGSKKLDEADARIWKRNIFGSRPHREPSLFVRNPC